MNELLSWGIVVAVVIGLIALAFNALQVVTSNDEFWIARFWFLFAATVLLARFIFWGITTNHSLKIRLIVCFIACGVIAVAAIEAVRYVNRKSNSWIKSKPTINESSKPQDRGDVEREDSEPPLVCVNTRIADIGFIRGFCTENASEKNARATVVAFGNKGNTATMKNDVKARITFYDSKDKHFQHINNGVWLEEEEKSIQYFDVGEVRELVVALLPSNGLAYAFDNEVMLDIATAGKELRVEVSLIGGIIPVMLGTFSFRLTLEPEVTIEEIKGD